MSYRYIQSYLITTIKPYCVLRFLNYTPKALPLITFSVVFLSSALPIRRTLLKFSNNRSGSRTIGGPVSNFLYKTRRTSSRRRTDARFEYMEGKPNLRRSQDGHGESHSCIRIGVETVIGRGGLC